MKIEFRTDRRGYLLTLERDLLGHFVLSRRWYGLHNRKWGAKRQVFLSEDEVMREIGRIRALRARHGYVERPEHLASARTDQKGGLCAQSAPRRS